MPVVIRPNSTDSTSTDARPIPAPVRPGGITVFNSLEQLRLFDKTITLDRTLMVVCVKGWLSGVIDVTPRRLSEGQVLVLREAHQLRKIEQSPDWEGFFILVENSKVDDILPLFPYLASCVIYFRENPIIDVTEEEMKTLRAIHDMFMQLHADDTRPYYRLSLNAMCDVLFYQTLGLYTARMTRRVTPPTRGEELLSRFIALVEKNYMRERTVMFYARRLCISPKHLSMVVKETSGRSAARWIEGQVILKAKMLLRNTGMTIQEISDTLNFSNQSFFGKYFKQKTGLSPRAFRANPDQ